MTLHGESAPLGATPGASGVNFSLFSRTATGVELLLFDREDADAPSRSLPLDPVLNRTYHYWHVAVPGVKAGQLYAYRVHGPMSPEKGLRFDASKVLLDPYGRGVVMPDEAPWKSVVVDTSSYDWEGDAPPRTPSARTVIYEMHVSGFTKNPNSGVGAALRGTYAGLAEKIPYLEELGVTAVELLPIHAFDVHACPPGLVNYWGYQPVSYFSPHPAYSARRDPVGPVFEFRNMVKALHRAGIEVILDVVFNHTAECGAKGKTFCYRGIDNPTYYILEDDPSRYADYSGCGNTVNANHPVVRRLILDSLRYWVQEMHVDGFRFDLASILARDAEGQVIENPPVLWDIESDPVLAGTKLMAEAWDAAGLYQVGSFVGDAWKEWNGRFRDDARDFWRGAPGSTGRFADRLLGSHDVYGHEGREAEQSVNFVACHDGFTLNDLVSYDRKHNERNGEENRDGSDDNKSWNCGVEGPSEDPAVEELRNRLVKNYLTVTMLALGVPMILMGDEVRRTQQGNNNLYCHDDASAWFDWTLVEKHADVRRFLGLLIQRRLLRSVESERSRISLTRMLAEAEKAWHGVKLDAPDWGESSKSMALSAALPGDEVRVYLALSAYSEPLDFELPPVEGGWRRWIDTTRRSPEDIVDWTQAPAVEGASYRVGPRSAVVLFARLR